MKHRARRVTIGALCLGALVVAVLVVACWGTVRDHVEAWHFQLTRETMTIPHPSGWPVILASGDRKALDTPITLPDRYKNVVTVDFGRALLEANGWRVLDQRFPRRAYVLIRTEIRQNFVLPPAE
jgi:hypothetical protein